MLQTYSFLQKLKKIFLGKYKSLKQDLRLNPSEASKGVIFTLILGVMIISKIQILLKTFVHFTLKI